MANVNNTMADFLNTVTEHNERKAGRLSEPASGISLATATETRASHIRKAVACLVAGLDNPNLTTVFNLLFAPRWECELGSPLNDVKYLKVRAAWNLVCIWLLARGNNAITAHSTFQESEEWFIGNLTVPTPFLSSIIADDNLKQALREIAEVPIDTDFWDLFPYVLEEHGPGSRASVLRDPSTKNARTEKKRQGIFYTPSDVADYMTTRALLNYRGDVMKALCLDPACGTGVFLRSLCGAVEKHANSKSFDRFQYVINNLFGFDINIHAVDASAFVMLQYCLADVNKRGLIPWAAWHAIRMNIACVDSLSLSSIEPYNNLFNESNFPLRKILKNLLISESTLWVAPEKVSLRGKKASCIYPPLFQYQRMIRIGDLLPEANSGFNILVGNPPYSILGERADYSSLTCEYSSLYGCTANSRDNTFLLFVEMMWRLTVAGQSSSAMVVPLSVAYNSGNQFKNCRSAITKKGGRWQFAFFDREPHALFGEEVKTRNAILFRLENESTPQRGEFPLIETGPLRRWTSRTRKHLFDSIQFTPIERFDITLGIPKIDGFLQVRVFMNLLGKQSSFPSFFSALGTCNLRTVIRRSNSNRVYIGGTAYNFLNVFRSFSVDGGVEAPLSESPVHCLEFISDSEASAAFAILSSRIVFWLWLVHADGFHVPGWFIRALPFHRESFSSEQFQHLSEIGAILWKKVQTDRFVSINSGKRTYTFRSLSYNEERDAIDRVLINALALPSEFAQELRNFIKEIVIVDRSDFKRQHLQNYFSKD